MKLSRLFGYNYLLMFALAASAASAASPSVVDIGGRRELFVDETLVEGLSGKASLRLHHPVPQEIVMVHDEPWEGAGSSYHSIFKDGDIYRMYYKSWHIKPRHKDDPVNPHCCAYAESDDGIHWRKPNLGLHSFNGSTENNILMPSGPRDGFVMNAAHPAVFKDSNPDAAPEARYKALFRSDDPKGLMAYQSPDGIHWELLTDQLILTDGAFDSVNLAFWDEVNQEYRAYWRYFADGNLEDLHRGARSIRTATSKDFIHWENQANLEYVDSPEEQLYTNAIKPYFRAPHILVGFPMRYIERGNQPVSAPGYDELSHAEKTKYWSASLLALPDVEHRIMRGSFHERFGSAVSEGLFMASRDGVKFKRWNSAFLRPGIERSGTWNYGHQYIGWQMVETKSALAGAPNELSLYAVEGYWLGRSSSLRRYTLRMDGFVSAHAAMEGGELVTKPITFTGDQLKLNFSTSAAGSVWVEIQDLAGNAIPGFTLAECEPLFGDTLEREITWQRGSDVSSLANRPVRLRFVLQDADVYAYRFGK